MFAKKINDFYFQEETHSLLISLQKNHQDTLKLIHKSIIFVDEFKKMGQKLHQLYNEHVRAFLLRKITFLGTIVN